MVLKIRPIMDAFEAPSARTNCSSANAAVSTGKKARMTPTYCAVGAKAAASAPSRCTIGSRKIRHMPPITMPARIAPQIVKPTTRRMRSGSPSAVPESVRPITRDTIVLPPTPKTPPIAIMSGITGRPKVIAASRGVECSEPMKPALMML